jgi:tetratricopeptide (TPR) repeat protein
MDAASSPDLSDVAGLRALAITDPAQAVGLAEAYLRGEQTVPAGEALAWSAAARALFDLGRHAEAIAAARQSLSGAQHLDRDAEIVLVLSLSSVLAESGDVDGALAILDDLASGEAGTSLGRVFVQRAYVLHHAGRLREALLSLDHAEPCFRQPPEPADELRLLLNRGLVLLQQGRLDEAESDLIRGYELAQQSGHVSFAAGCKANLGVLYGRARRVRDATASFAVAAELYRRAGDPARVVAVMHIDRAETLVHVGVDADALDAARLAVSLAMPTGNLVLAGDAQLMLARVLLFTGRMRAAADAAETAASLMERASRSRMVSHARAITALAEMATCADRERAVELLGRAADVAGLLEGDGWDGVAAELRLARIRFAERHQLSTLVAGDLERLRLGAFSAQRDVGLAGWYAESIARAAVGETDAAIDACRSGLGLLDDIVAEAPTLDQRSAAMRLGSDLSQRTIELAVERGDADVVLAAAEGTRARALHDELAEARRHRPLSEEGAEALRRELGVRLRERVLVEWVEVGEETWAVVFQGGKAGLVQIGATRQVLQARDRLLVHLDLAVERPDDTSVRAHRAARLVEELLVRPLGLPDEADVVIVPVGGTHGIPWAGLPGLAGRAVSLVPNAQLWLEADRRAVGVSRSVGLIVGPGVVGAHVERAAVENLRLDVSIAAGAGATAATVRSMFASVDVVHVAAHGCFRSDHPLLSTLRLHDGESTLYDTVPERVASRLVVLSSCEGGAHGSSDGSEVLGLGAVMLARGAASVLAPLTVVRELECADFVADVHAELAGRTPIGAAVARVRQRWLADDDLSRWAVASSFTCFGSDAVTVG